MYLAGNLVGNFVASAPMTVNMFLRIRHESIAGTPVGTGDSYIMYNYRLEVIPTV